jgi:hypothetical protein
VYATKVLIRGLLLSIVCTALTTTVRAADDAGVELVKSAAPAVKRGARATVSLTLLPRAGNRLLADGPLLVRVSGDGVAPERALYRRDDAVDPHAEAPRFELAFRGERAGAAVLRARLTFYVCRGARCRPVEADADWSFDVTP